MTGSADYPAATGRLMPYRSTEDAIATWPTTATAIGVRLDQGRPQVVAPYGLDDLLGLILRANRVQITPGIFRDKVARWQRHWPNLTRPNGRPRRAAEIPIAGPQRRPRPRS